MAGFGLMAAGFGPFGYGTPASADAPPDGPSGVRFIHPRSKDFEQDPDTLQLKQMPPYRQAVLIALATLEGSSTAQPTFGVRLPPRMGNTFEAEVNAAVRKALHHLTDIQKVIRVDRVTAEKGLGGRARITVSYTVVATGKDDQVTVAPGST
jgi:phage baseplate assembly protein W